MPLQKHINTLIFFLLLGSSVSATNNTTTDYTTEPNITISDSSSIYGNFILRNKDITDSIIDYGRLYLNRPYRFGSTGSDSFDCSGFTSFVYRNFGYTLTHSSSAQANQFDAVRRDNLRKGDLVYFKGSRRGSRIGHVGIVTNIRNNGQFDFIHASCDHGVTISSSEEPYYSRRYVMANRVIAGKQIMAANLSLLSDPFDEEQSEPYTLPVNQPSNTTKKTNPAQYHKVKKGETLADIASRYGVSVADLKSMNRIKGNKLTAKQNLKVKEAETYTEVEPIAPLAANTSKQQGAESTVSHQVRKGETLESIAQQYGVKVEDITKNNRIRRGRLAIGQTLRFERQIPTAATTETTGQTHKVVSGDSYYSIARRYNISVEELKEANKSEKLRAGDVLTIPGQVTAAQKESVQTVQNQAPLSSTIKAVQSQTREEAKNVVVPEYKPIPAISGQNIRIINHKVHAGESLQTISRDFKVSIDELKQINNLQSNYLPIGSTIFICVNVGKPVEGPTRSKLPVVISTNKKEDAEENIESTTKQIPATQVEEKAYTAPAKSSYEAKESATNTYTVQRHDNLRTIARKFNLTVDQLKSINKLQTTKVSAGQKLNVSPENNIAENKKTTLKDQETTDYKVRKGDNIYSIAKQNNMTVDELIKLNNISKNRVSVGQIIKVSGSTGEKSKNTEKEVSFKTYKVRKGDNIAKIATKFGTTEEAIRDLNNINSNKLSNGLILKIPEKGIVKTENKQEAKKEGNTIAYKIKKGDNLASIAEKYGTTAEAIKEQNNIKGNKLTVGKKLKIETYPSRETEKAVATKSKQNQYTVKKGDNLETIAQEHNTSVEDIKELNGLKNNKIEAGKTLIVATTDKRKTETTKNEKEKRDKKDKTTTYTIKKGDNLESIAQKHNMTTEELKELNGIDGSRITAGKELKVYEEHRGEKNESKKQENSKSATHEVKKGESLSTIAEQYGISVDELKEMNNLNNNNIHAGQELNVKQQNNKAKTPVKTKTIHHTVKPGESFYSIAEKYDCTIDEIKDWNNKKESKIKPGEKLIIKTQK